MTSLLSACQEGSAQDVVSLLQEQGGDPNLPLGPGGGGPLHHAVAAGHAHLVSLLLSHVPGIEPNMVNSEGMTPVHLAASQGRDKIVRLMVKSDLASVDINKKCFQDFSPLLTAAMAGFRFCVSALLSSKFLDLNTEWEGLRAETLAEQNGHKRIVQIIKEERKYRDEHPDEFPNHRPSRPSTRINVTSERPNNQTRARNDVPSSTKTKSSSSQSQQRKVRMGGTDVCKVGGARAQSFENETGDWRAEFECPVCLEEMRAGVQIFQCGSGHLTCGTCRPKIERNTCPTCRGEFTGRALAMERLAAALLRSDQR